ncbi:ketol-acid reductoisomerase [Thermogymnomonas acidicola]|uniref:Ketol-acid reductoisomerase (NADP(+)) n=1 Tax=Thermogymnomonas acidicola TaxID=399579 RepID=A0AA37F9C8_9ARCH|nr:ketol-acid reductoisomerase [Thermogymnomonas acidicola]GGM73326.1 ketol-acid reductoisomerase [Thermogymnomonas acidicola]
MVNVLTEKDADMKYLDGKTVAVIGYGIQGRAQALNLRDSGVDVIVGVRKNGESYRQARDDGFEPMEISEAADAGDVIMVLIPDETQERVYRESIMPHLTEGKTLEFAHGFNIRFRRIVPPANVDVIMVAPKAPGAMVRKTFLEGFGTPSLVAVEQDYTGKAFQTAMAIAKGIGATRAGVIRTTFTEETETDLFGEQVVLCGGISQLIKRAFDFLVSRGYQPEIAYFEVLHEMKLIVDLIQAGGIENMWDGVSNTAEYGGRTRGGRVIDEHYEAAMDRILRDIKDGSFAKEWMDEYYSGQKNLDAMREKARKEQIEVIGKEIRAMFRPVKERASART